MQVDEVEDQVVLTTFQARLLLGDFYFSISKTPLKTVMELLYKAHKYMNTKDACASKGMVSKRRNETNT